MEGFASAWIRTLPQPGNSAIVGRGEDDSSFNFAWQLYMNGVGNLQLTLENVNETNFCYPQACGQQVPDCTAGDLFVADDSWHHVAVTRDSAGTVTFYVDGLEEVTCVNSGVPSSNNVQFLTIGCTHFFIGPPPGGEEPTDWFFPGLIDEPAVWSAALSQPQIMEIVESGVDPTSPQLVGHWAFDKPDGQTVLDASSLGNDGFLGESETPDSADPMRVSLGGDCPADIDGDGMVGIGDFLLVLGRWGPCPAPCPPTTCAADVDSDCQVGINDFLIVLGDWGLCDN